MKILLAISWVFLLCTGTVAATIKIQVQASPGDITAGGTSTIGVRVTADGVSTVNRTVKAQLIDGTACGKLDYYELITNTAGSLQFHFIADQYAKDCAATVQVFVDATATDGAAQASTVINVGAASTEAGKVDGLGAIAFVLIVSFAIDRLIRGFFFLLSYSKAWSRRFPDPELDGSRPSVRAERNRRLLFVALAMVLGLIALAWFGRIRLLASLGFTGVNPLLDVLVTGLILVGGAESTEHLLRAVGGAAGSPSESKPKPLEITGRLTIDDQTKHSEEKT